jgi:hypothetical protein
MLKRTMYGRAGFSLLRARVLLADSLNDSTEFAGDPNFPRQRFRHDCSSQDTSSGVAGAASAAALFFLIGFGARFP